MFFLQITSPQFPVVVKMGHAHSGMGKVNLEFLSIFSGPREHTDVTILIFSLLLL